MSLPNPILQWNSRYLQTDIPALQVFDQIRPESLCSIRPLPSVQQPDPRPRPRPRTTPRARPEANAGPASPGPGLAGDPGCGGSVTGHPDRGRGFAGCRLSYRLRGRSARARGGGVARLRGPGALVRTPAHLKGG